MDPKSPDYDYKFALEYEDEDWICPNVTSINLLNDPYMLNTVSGISFLMVVNPCDIAVEIGDKKILDRGLTQATYTDKACLEHGVGEEISNFATWAKI